MAHDPKQLVETFRSAALTYPGAYEESPWGERVTKVKGKIFVFSGARDEGLNVTVKLPSSAGLALSFAFATPTGYGLGKSGWVTARFAASEDVPVGLILDWMDESYRAVAPKKLVVELDRARAQESSLGASSPASAGDSPVRPEAAPAQSDATSARTGAVAAGTVALLVGDDPLRLDRAAKGLSGEGARVVRASVSEEALAVAAREAPTAVLVDLGRRESVTLELARSLVAAGVSPDRIAFAGARDAKSVAAAKKAVAGAAFARREPPGDPATVGDLVARLTEKVSRAPESREPSRSAKAAGSSKSRGSARPVRPSKSSPTAASAVTAAGSSGEAARPSGKAMSAARPAKSSGKAASAARPTKSSGKATSAARPTKSSGKATSGPKAKRSSKRATSGRGAR